jgi:BirA family transcriptional regulator, biotin operon repressor / biotin---[acetyl-CoA-carboxylase] ligase
VRARLGAPRLHLRATDSTNLRARTLAGAGARHGTIVTAAEQSAGRGRQGRHWSAPPGQALLLSVVLREWGPLLPLAAAVAVAETAGERARVKWPNDVLLDEGKVAGILIEARPQEGWAIAGVGLNVAVDVGALPPELHATAATLARPPADVERVMVELVAALERWLAEPADALLHAYRARDALAGRDIEWAAGRGRAVGIDDGGRLLVETAEGRVALDAGEVHLAPAGSDRGR